MTNRLAVRDGFVIFARETVAHTVRFIKEIVMIINAQFRNHVSHAAEREASRLLPGDPAGDYPDDDLSGDTAEICRMIEMSGMIGLECGLLDGE